MIDSLPESLLGEILDYLLLEERFQTIMSCRAIWELRISLHRLVRRIALTTPTSRRLFLNSSTLLRYWTNLLELDVGSYANNVLLRFMGTVEHAVPQLTTFSMVASTQITNEGLEVLSRARSRPLRYVDITYCSNTTYAGTFPLRDAYPSLILRRQPAWMDGKFVTPFDNDGIHTYWCDGSFLFERDQQSCGHVCGLSPWSTSHIGDKLQYTNFSPPDGWPDWSRFCYRPGVSLLRLDQGMSSNGDRHILVGQRLYGMRPPPDYPKPEHAALVPLHASRYFDRHGKLLEEDNHQAEERFVMVSRMKVLSLAQGLMPPSEVVEANREFLQRLTAHHQSDASLARGEDLLHNALNRE